MAGRRPIRSGPKRTSTWFFVDPSVTTMTVTGGTIIGSLNAAALALRPFTIVRSHFELLLKSDQSAATENQVAAFGLAVVSDQAAAVGVSAVPTPDTDSGSDLWFVHQYLMGAFDFTTGTGYRNVGERYSVDSKAMRKVDIGQDLVIVAEMDSNTSSGVILFSAGRILVKNN